MKGKRKTASPCPRCLMHPERCFCAEIPRLTLKTRVSLVIHHKELRRTTNSGRLLTESLTNSELFVRGLKEQALDLGGLILPDYENLLFYPSDDAVEVSAVKTARPVHLIVPDGNWRQAGKVAVRHPELAGLRRVKISSANLAEFHLRKEHHEFGMSTLEAVAQAIALLEGQAAAEPLLRLYKLKLKRTLEGRGIHTEE